MKGFGVKMRTAVLASLVFFGSCEKINLDPVTELKVRLTDAPVNAQEVNVHIKEVRVNYSKDTSWTSLSTKAGVYNLLDYQNGKDTLIAKGGVKATNVIQELRLILGEDNSLKINNETFPLQISNGFEKSLRVIVDKKMNREIETILIDFDAALSIIETSKGSYQLRPVLKVK
jgi:hypothetical protein